MIIIIYTLLEAIVGVIAGILLAACTKKAEGVVYGKLDKAGRITNILLLLLYICTSPLCMVFGFIAVPRYTGFLGILGWIVSIIIASATLFAGLGLGASVALRKKGESKKSFIVQFAGVAGVILTVGLYALAGNLLQSLD